MIQQNYLKVGKEKALPLPEGHSFASLFDSNEVGIDGLAAFMDEDVDHIAVFLVELGADFLDGRLIDVFADVD